MKNFLSMFSSGQNMRGPSSVFVTTQRADACSLSRRSHCCIRDFVVDRVSIMLASAPNKTKNRSRKLRTWIFRTHTVIYVVDVT